MEELMKQTRLRIPGQGQGFRAKSISKGETALPRQGVYFEQGNKEQHLSHPWLSRNISGDMYSEDIEHATAVAAAAFSVHSIEDAEMQYQKKRREIMESTRSRTKSTGQASMSGMPNPSTVTRRFSNKEAKNAGEAFKQNSMRQDLNERERVSSVRPRQPSNVDQKQKGNFPRTNAFRGKADAWEKAQMQKIKHRYEKTKAAIVAWENERKIQVKTRIEKKQRELEKRRQRNQQYYQNKLARIDQIARGAKSQVEEKRRKDESVAKDKAKKMRSTGKIPVTCFCF